MHSLYFRVALHAGNQVTYAFRATENPPYFLCIHVFTDDWATEHKEWDFDDGGGNPVAYDGCPPS
ncbi:hypothetical protein EAJ17_03120 [Akkermansia sp. aa_0143]|nr:hypothetical protein EAJ17_03120 [Akkermansia sp. aa_0143]